MSLRSLMRLIPILALSVSAAAADLPAWPNLQWLAGCWQASGAEPGSEEHWLAPAGGAMLGVSRSVRKGKMAEYEFLRIHEQDGQLYFTAKPSGQPEASFRLVSSEPGQMQFENPQHDFPQRISYRQQADGSLLARIEGTRNGKTRAIDFPMGRIPCGG
ncbi:DUF6265 family protein [Chitinimonas naiadis]